MSEVTFACSHCGNEHPISEQYEIDGELLCASCAEEQTVVCSICGTRIWRDSNSGNENMPLCERCYDRSYSSCIRCGALVHNDDAIEVQSDTPIGDVAEMGDPEFAEKINSELKKNYAALEAVALQIAATMESLAVG